MNDFNMNEYADLAQTGHVAVEPTSPEDDFFHSVYIAGVSRTNEAGIREEAGNLQVRGVEYNLQKVNMIVIHVKDVNVKIKSAEGSQRESIECFSYKSGQPPYHGTTKENGQPRQCPANSVERSASEFCSPCRNQIIMAGVYCDNVGKPILNEERKPTFVFIRGKGMKYKNVSNYISDMYNLDLDPIFTPPTDESRSFEKQVVNIKRFVTEITIAEEGSRFGPKKVFQLTKGQEIGKEFVREILQVSKKTLNKFNDKFDWSKRKQTAQGQTAVEGVLPADGSDMQQNQENNGVSLTSENNESKKPDAPEQKPFSFDDVKFD